MKKIFQKILIFLGLKNNWIAKKGTSLQIIIHAGCGVTNYRKYKVVKGKYSRKSYDEGRWDDNGYQTIELFRPKTKEARILVWYTFHKTTKKYLVILRKDYNNKIILS